MAAASKTFRSLSALAALLFLTACATAPRNELGATIDRITATPPLQHAIWGILVEDDAGSALYERNAHTLLMPASNRKLFASATIANCLGFDGRLTTEVFRDGDDVVLRGDGDPSLGSWRYERDTDFDLLAADLRARGITQVRDVIADVSLFDRNIIPGSWKYGNIGSDYSAPVDAIAWGESEIANDRAVADPGLHAAEQLRARLIMAGIAVSGIARVSTERRAWGERVAALQSPFVAHLLTTVLKNSHNLYAEMLLKRTATARPATYASALQVDRDFLEKEVGLVRDEFKFVDASGLAPDDLVTPSSTVRILRWMNDPARRGMWWSILAQPANEGTLRRRLAKLEHRMRGKTGTINGVAALSGIIRGERGGHRYFAVVVNHHATDGDDVVKAIDAVVTEIAKF
jgi:D-alanyl-D-alanine carboxypeptidase/D-alanyl-D-alanine-endopeptidase (penicillin-binding protein 4)